jgi:hypothetical protein
MTYLVRHCIGVYPGNDARANLEKTAVTRRSSAGPALEALSSATSVLFLPRQQPHTSGIQGPHRERAARQSHVARRMDTDEPT